MLNRKSNFTLIELIVVIVVLGILAAIVIPNISSFSDEARDVQLTADARNMQTAVDMFRAKSDSGTEDPVTAVEFTATYEYIVPEGEDEYEHKLLPVENVPGNAGLDGIAGNADDVAASTKPGTQVFKLVDTDKLKDKHLRKLPKYVKNDLITAAADIKVDNVNFEKGQVVAGILQGADKKSTAIVKFVTPIANPDTTAGAPAEVLSVVR